MAIRQGIAFARAIRAKVTALAVSPSFHLFEVDPIMVGYTPLPEQYARDSEARAEKYLAVARVEAGIAGVPCETVHATQDHVYEAIIDTGQQERLRSDLHGLARAQGDLGARARQRDLQSTQSQQDPGPGLPVSSPRSSG